ncbi:hypothetical protein JF540_12880 [Salipiger thiooxidans]|uniref:hypothetical protein n=1 Tax=Salipiger thiooxidans TaxID=282683 RepID=UPI001A90A91D|nr:hypothetical protein [Salipiger thiooxidans]MBN8187585.1 hypothetical protein [Salipiger thiooxidans]
MNALRPPRRDMADITSGLTEALEVLRMTEETLVARNADESAARRAATDALNAHNEAQKRVDELVEQLRDTRHGDWARRKMIPARLGHCSTEAAE